MKSDSDNKNAYVDIGRLVCIIQNYNVKILQDYEACVSIKIKL